MEFAKQTIAITGASSGIGAAIARELAPHVGRLILIARREDRLRALAEELPIPCDVEPCDLADFGAVTELADRLAAREVDGLVNNAGLGASGCTWTMEEERLQAMLDVNVRALVALSRGLLPGMVERGRGFVFNVGSVAGVQPVPFMSVYAATKSFVNHFSEALASELEGTGVWCGVLCPGSTRTEFFETAEVDTSQVPKVFQTSEAVAAAAVAAMRRGRVVTTPGWINRWVALGARLAPRAVRRRIAKRVMRGLDDRTTR